MKRKYNKQFKAYIVVPETAIEAVTSLKEFFMNDMWYATASEWKTESDMIKYLNSHFNICLRQIKKCKKVK